MSEDTPSTLNRPEGYHRMRSGGGFIGHNGPLHLKRMPDHVRVGFRVDERHLNPMGNLHGGMLATFADMLLPIIVHHQSEVGPRFLPTISLQVDYLAAAKLGQWVEGRSELLRATRNLVFAQGLVHADDTLIARVSGTFKMGPEFKPEWIKSMGVAGQ